MRGNTLIIPALLLLLLTACTKKESLRSVNSSGEYIYVEDDKSWQPVKAVGIKKGMRLNDHIEVRRWGRLFEIFNDSNKYHYAFAKQIGIKPILDFSQTYMTNKPLVKVQTCKYYFVDSLEHSLPYLVPRAELLLRDIGRNFIDSLALRGADGYRVRATSLLRTKSSVRKLRRVNVNASDSSTHQFGTTFDLSWSRFDCLDSTRTINNDDLKWLLAEVLEDLRSQGRCLVKFERKTHCFHITTTK